MSRRDRKQNIIGQNALFGSGHADDTYPYQHRNSIVATAKGENHVTLTQSLLDSHPEQLTAATQAPFLRAAGSGQLSKTVLSQWLSQDRLYAETYICFISSLLARVHLPYTFISDKSKSLRWRIVRMLTGALENIHHELEFFETTAKKYDLDLEAPGGSVDSDSFSPAQATQQYMDLFRSFYNDPTLPLIEGMVVLWATERCYLSAWTYASGFLAGGNSETDQDGGALREAFIPNWSSSEFEKFVDDIAELTDLLAERDNAGKKLEVYKAVWSHVLDIETRFWPAVDG